MSQHPFYYKAKSPSNIAFIKYWGKKNTQEPINPSMSMTLENCYTLTELTVLAGQEDIKVDFFLDGMMNEKFQLRVIKYIKSLGEKYPVLNHCHFKIETSNTFPHSSGIASSASGFSALALCLGAFLKDQGILNDSVSSLARLGSGSACRSLVSPFAFWGNSDEVIGSSDEEAIEFPCEAMPELSDIIFLLETKEKSHSSSLGHEEMNFHPYKKVRIEQVKRRIKELKSAFSKGDFSSLGKIIEEEALELHALMMTSPHPFWLMSPETLNLMNYIKELRIGGLDAFFTLDAGANLHLISLKKDQDKIIEKVKEKFPAINFIKDSQGQAGHLLV